MTNKAPPWGINRYQVSGADLRGCVNDIENMRAVLQDLSGFADDDIRVLTDLEATKANIEAAFHKRMLAFLDGRYEQVSQLEGRGMNIDPPFLSPLK